MRDISKNFESKQPEQPVSRTPSFNKRSQKLDEKDKDKEATGREEERESEESSKVGQVG